MRDDCSFGYLGGIVDHHCINGFCSCYFKCNVYCRANKTAYAIIAREMAPAQASETMYTNRSSTLGKL